METKLDIQINQSIISVLGKKLYQSSFGTVVLRELIQNSLDAGATKIDVQYDESSKTLMVSDNGTGIEKIDGLLNVIGESIKDNNIETIGGYGLAKLAIFGCKFWQFESKSGTFSSGFIFDPDKVYNGGTIVTCEFGMDDLNWKFKDTIKSYLMAIERKSVEFIYNDEILTGHLYSTFRVGDSQELTANTIVDNGNVIVRVNGLPTFRHWMPNLNETIFLDYHVICSPYDDNYPLTSNRDGFLQNTSEYDDFVQRVKQIEKKLETDKLEKENINKKITKINFRNKEYLAGGNLTKNDFKEYSKTLSTYERYINQIAKLEYYEDISTCMFGLTDGLNNEDGMYDPNNKGFFIKKEHFNKGHILSVAMHEFVHFLGYGTCGHDENFSSRLTQLTGTILNAIYSGEFRK